MSAVRSINFAAGRAAVAARPRRARAAHAIAQQLYKAEDVLDQSASELAMLLNTLICARREANISKTVGQELLDDAAEAQRLVIAGLQRVAALHAKGLKLTEEMGLTKMDFGDNSDDKHKPDFIGEG